MHQPTIPAISTTSIFHNPHLFPTLPSNPSNPTTITHPIHKHTLYQSSSSPLQIKTNTQSNINKRSSFRYNSINKLQSKSKNEEKDRFKLVKKSKSKFKYIHNRLFSFQEKGTEEREEGQGKKGKQGKESRDGVVLTREEYVQGLEERKIMHLEKLKLNISMCLTKSGQKWNTNNSNQDIINRRVSYSLDLHKKSPLKQNPNKKLPSKHLSPRHDLCPSPSQNQPSIRIKQLKPQPKQFFKQNQPIIIPKLGKTYGSYYQIVAIEKKFENSKYFFNQFPQFLVEDGIDVGRKSGGVAGDIAGSGGYRRVGENWVKERGSRIYYEGGMIEPWKMNDDHHIHQGFL